jgi:hypothetical protein
MDLHLWWCMDAGAGPFRGTERFELAYRIGAGGMGVVYAALDRAKNTRIALKTIKDADSRSIARFKDEFRQLADVAHPNLVRLGELFCADGTWFFTMELVEGTSFLRYVVAPGAPVADTYGDASPSAPTDKVLFVPDRSPVWFDEKRLRGSLAQLCLGVSVLHGAGKVHRDVKPSNILVTDTGRVVLLDFGLVTDAKREVNTGGLVGTARYMAPEQAAEGPVGPAADWYSVGAVLYEALTGRVPFVGSQMQILMSKLQYDPPAPKVVANGVPDDLNELCLALLRREPKMRPREAEILLRLGFESLSGSVTTASSLTEGAPFVGRTEELAILRRAWEHSRHGAVTVLVRGESGIGKSSLVRRFVEDLKEEQPGLLVLSGRCYERESVPYKAFDAVMDTLSHYLAHMDPVQAALLLTERAASLAKIFPVLRRCPVMSKLPEVSYPDPQEMRSRAFAAFRQLFVELARRQPLVVCIDDLQWTDPDSVTLLGDLLHPPDAPRLLLLATEQTGIEADPLAEVSERLGEVRRLELGGLSDTEARALAEALRPASLPARVDKVTADAGGHPLYLTELLRSPDHRSDLLLDDLLGERIGALPAPAQSLLEVLAVAGIPLRHAICAEAAGLDPEELARQVSLLRVAHLLRGTGARGREALETYHSRVRLAVVRRLSGESLTARHGSLARSLEASGENPLALIRHLEGAGDAVRAAEHAQRAAEHSVEALAFDQAAELYRTALRLGRYGAVHTSLLQRGLGGALAGAGRGWQAAAAYRQAAEGAESAEAMDLHRLAAEQLLRSGHIDEGIAALEPVLASAGLRLAKTNRQALSAAAWWYLRARLRGLDFVPRKESEVPPAELRRIDLCWTVIIGMVHADHFRTADFQMRYMALALKAGEPTRVVPGLGLLAVLAGASGSRSGRRVTTLLARMEQIARDSGDIYAMAFTHFTCGQVAQFAGHWSRARQFIDRAESLFRDRCRRRHWEITTCRMSMSAILYVAGDWKLLAAKHAAWQREAEERQDAYGCAWTRCGRMSCAWLVQDDVAEARRQAHRAREGWSQQGLLLHGVLQFMSQVAIALYASPTSPEAWQAAADGWPSLRRTMMLRFQLVLIDAHTLRACAALCIAAGSTGPVRETFLRHAEKDARTIERERSHWGDPLALLIRAAVATLRGRPDRALSVLDKAASQFDQAGMPGHAAIARLRRGQLLGGEEGQALVLAGVAYMQRETIRNPARWADLLAPGFAPLDPRSS